MQFRTFWPLFSPLFSLMSPIRSFAKNNFLLYKFPNVYILPYKSSERNNSTLSRYLKKMLLWNFPCFLCMVVNPQDKKWEKWKLLFDLVLELFDAENIVVIYGFSSTMSEGVTILQWFTKYFMTLLKMDCAYGKLNGSTKNTKWWVFTSMVVQVLQNSTPKNQFNLKMHSTKMYMQPQMNG